MALIGRSGPSQPWLHSARVDSWCILAPAFLATVVALLLEQVWKQEMVPLWGWVLLILGVDVAHVYSTLFRTYWNSDEREVYGALLIIVPVVGWLGGVLLYSIGSATFWRVLAYVAVFHFIRQQYGFMRLYARKESTIEARWRWLDSLTIYTATVYPLIYWHTHLPRAFHWFVEGDFLRVDAPQLSTGLGYAYGAVLLCYIGKESWLWLNYGMYNLPKNGIVFGSALSWYVGIVWCEGDLAFTTTNVVAHGIPYLALIWVYGQRREAENRRPKPWSLPLHKLFTGTRVPLFMGLLFLLAFVEEGLWDALIWREHQAVFGFVKTLPQVTSETTLTWLVPLLALPQITHYVIDGFIWRRQTPSKQWQSLLFRREAVAS